MERWKGKLNMIGRQVIKTTRKFTLEELEQFMREHWDIEEYNDFFIGKPTSASIENYILLPATKRFMVAVYPRSAGWLFSKENKVILIVCDTPSGAIERLSTSIRSKDILFGSWKIGTILSSEKERKGPAEEVLQKYAAYLRELLKNAGYMI